MIRLQASMGIHRREKAREPDALIFDQGPVYTVAWLHETKAQSPGTDCEAQWEKRAVLFWAQALDAVIMLDAPDEVLLNRIRGRSKPHSLRAGSPNEARKGLGKERALQEAALEKLTKLRSSLPVIRFDTSKQTSEQIATATLRALGFRPPDNNNGSGSSTGDGALFRPSPMTTDRAEGGHKT